MSTKFAQFPIAQWQWWSIIVDHFAHHFVAWTFFINIVASQIAHQFDLAMRNFNWLFEYHPNDRFREWWCGQWAQICPECRRCWQQFGRITAIGESDLRLKKKIQINITAFFCISAVSCIHTRSPLCVMNGSNDVILLNSSWCSPIWKKIFEKRVYVKNVCNMRCNAPYVPSRKRPAQLSHPDV